MEQNLTIIPPDQFVFIPIGGATDVGMNLFAYGYRGKYIIVDCGMGFPSEGGLPGVDALLPNVDFFDGKQQDVLGFFITHSHLDHIGAIGRLWPDLQCPIYATKFTAEMVKNQLEEVHLENKAPVIVVDRDARISLDPFEIELVRVNHTTPEPSALAIRTHVGTVVHMGDWQLTTDPFLNQSPDIQRFRELGEAGVLALVSDSTTTSSEKTDKTEADVRTALTELIGQYPDKQIAVGCFPSNVSRVSSIAHAARANQREVCLLGRSLWRIDAAARASGYFADLPPFLTEKEALAFPAGSVVYIATGTQGEPRAALMRLSAATRQKNAVFLDRGDVVIFSSRVIPGNDKEIDFLQKRFKAKGVTIITNKEATVHVGGHYAGEDLETLYELVRPHIALPVHGNPVELMQHMTRAKAWGVKFAYAMENGEVLALSKTPEILGEVEARPMALDGNRQIPLDSEIIKKRRKMMAEGTAVVTLVMDKDGDLLADPVISTFGLLETADEGDLERLNKRIIDQLAKASPANLISDEFIHNLMRATVRGFLRETYGKGPILETHLVRV